jgi:glycyl-tRNA synthetase beta chain
MRRKIMRDFLVEIHTEELPPKSLKRLADKFLQEIETRLTKSELKYESAQFFVTPRRLAVLVTQLANQQPDSIVERKGPALAGAFDQNGQPTPACLGFARSCGTTPEQLQKTVTPQGEWMSYQQKVPGKSVQTLLPEIIQQALVALPIPKRMRWGNNTVEFVRPIHSIILLYGNEVIPADIFGLKSGRKTRGHRFHSNDWFDIAEPAEYVKILKKHFVLADFEERKEKIRALTTDSVKKLSEKIQQSIRADISETLLDEVSGLVEWPVVLCGHFDPDFLEVPQEALISAMQDHQRYFPVVNEEGKLQPYFITISNIESKNPAQVIAGNERVLRARLSDAKFFFDADVKWFYDLKNTAWTLSAAPGWFNDLQNISAFRNLKSVTYINKLGTLWDKSVRLSQLSRAIAEKIGTNDNSLAHARSAGLLAKFDLSSQLVGEFPELQGIAGSYYINGGDLGKTTEISQAVREHYLPRFSGDILPTTLIGCALALADRIDMLVGLFGINQIPTGDKDPLGMRRAALSILRIMIEEKCNCDLRELIQESIAIYQRNDVTLANSNLVNAVLTFIFERLKPWYQEQSISADVYAAVAALNITRPYDFHCRILAVQAFKKLPEANALNSANKRVSNILNKYDSSIVGQVNSELFEEEAEHQLAASVIAQHEAIIALSQSEKYAEILTQLAALREPVDYFFDKVLVMTEDKPRRENRLLLLKQLRELFLHVADIALLQ